MPVLVGTIAVSCDKKDLDEVSPSASFSTEGTNLAVSGNLIFADDMESGNPFSGAHGLELGAPHSLTSASRPDRKSVV